MSQDVCRLCGSPNRGRVTDVVGARLVRCGNCRLVRTDSASTSAYDENYYSASYLSGRLNSDPARGMAGIRSRVFDRVWQTYLGNSTWLDRTLLLPFRNRAGGIPPREMPFGDLLDVGCGDGDFIFRARQHGWRVRGSEVNVAAVKSARAAGLTVDLGELESVGYGSQSFDVVRAWHVLEHVPEPLNLLRQMRRLLRPGGLAIVGVPNYASGARRILGGRWRGLQPQYHLNHFDARTLRSALVTAGFKIVSMQNRSVGTAYASLSADHPRLFANPIAWSILLALDDLADILGIGDSLEALASVQIPPA